MWPFKPNKPKNIEKVNKVKAEPPQSQPAQADEEVDRLIRQLKACESKFWMTDETDRKAIKRLGELGNPRAIEILSAIASEGRIIESIFEANEAIRKIRARAVARGNLSEQSTCAYQDLEFPDIRCDCVAETAMESQMCILHTKKTQDFMVSLCLKLRDSEWAALKTRYIKAITEHMHKSIIFKGVSFYPFDNFHDHTFPSAVDFSHSHFCEVQFLNCVFKGSASFKHARFESFKRLPVFVNCTFERPVSFQHAKFINGGGGFEDVTFLQEVDLSEVDFQYSIFAYPMFDEPEQPGFLFRNVSFRNPPALGGAKGIWGFVGAPNEVVAKLIDAPFAQMPEKFKTRYHSHLKVALDDILGELNKREDVSSEEVSDVHSEFCSRRKAKFPLRILSALELQNKLEGFFGRSIFTSFQIEYIGPRWLELIGSAESYAIGIYVSHEGKDRFYAFGHVDF